MTTIFIAYTLKNSSVAEFFTAIANKLATKNKVVLISYQTESYDYFLDKSIEVLEWPSVRPTGIKDFLFLSKLVRKYKPSIMISNFAAVNLFLLVGFLKGVKHRICWYHTHSSAHIEENKFHLLRKSAIYRLATKIITTSSAAKDDISKHYHVNKKKIFIIPNAVRNLENPPKLIENLKLIYVGRLHPVKGFEIFLKSLPKVISLYPEVQVKVIGGGAQEISKYLEQAKKLNIAENLEFKSFTSKSNVMTELADSYVCIVPSYFEAFCYVVIESLSVGTPVIGSDTTGIGEIIENGKCGYLFEPGNHDELSDKILSILENPVLRKEMSINAYKLFKEKYEIKGVSKQFIKLLDA